MCWQAAKSYVADNTLLMVRHRAQPYRLVLSICGTHPLSVQNWFQYNMDVVKLAPWPWRPVGPCSVPALAGGFAGGLGNSRDQEPATLIAGVAVATALMPPLCAAGYGIAIASGSLFLSALYEFGINVVFIALAAEAVLLLLRVPLKRDLNGDGIVTAEEDAEVDELSRKVRRRIIVGTVIFAIPCIIMTAGAIGSAQAGVQDGYGVTETTRELAAVLPGFKDYTVAVETSATEGEEEGLVEREVVAHVTTSEALGAHDRRVARKLIDLNVPELDRVEFDAAFTQGLVC